MTYDNWPPPFGMFMLGLAAGVLFCKITFDLGLAP